MDFSLFWGRRQSFGPPAALSSRIHARSVVALGLGLRRCTRIWNRARREIVRSLESFGTEMNWEISGWERKRREATLFLSL